MANFYWVGGSTATSGAYTEGLGGAGQTGAGNCTWVRAFDWNNPLNWRVRTGNLPGSYRYEVATRCPGISAMSATTAIQDVAIFGSSEYNTGLGLTGYELPRAIAPCLWGGASAAGATTIWLGAGAGAATVNYAGTLQAGLANLMIDWKGGRTSDSVYGLAQYPFSFIGLPGGFAQAADGGTEFSPLYEAQALGFALDPIVWAGASWESLIAAVVATGGNKERLEQLRVKTEQVSTPTQYVGAIDQISFGKYTASGAANSAKNLGRVTLDLMKNFGVLSGSSSGSTANYVNTYCSLNGPAQFSLSGYANTITRSCINLPAQPTGSNYAPRPTLGLEGITVVNVYQSLHIGSFSYNDSNIGSAVINPQTNNYFGQVQSKFDQTAIWNEILNIGNTSGGNSASLSPNLTLHTAGTTASLSTFNGLYIGGPGVSVTANWFKLGTPGAVPPFSVGRTNVYFSGNASFNKIEAAKSYISASTIIPVAENAEVKVAELFLTDGCTLDFAANTQFDNWIFGKQDGYSIVGGIIFQDEESIIKGSNGVRLFNDQMVVGAAQSQAGGKRSGAKANPPVLSVD